MCWQLKELLWFCSTVKSNKTKFINNIEITQEAQYNGNKGTWFKDIKIHVNYGMVAIIGNKGSGKSALADIIGLCGNSYTYDDFSFLNNERFLKNNLAKHFKANIEWANGEKISKNLLSNVDYNAPERVRYLPQNFFDRLTNNLDNYDFQTTLENIVFSYLPDEEKLGKNSFKELITYKNESISKDVELILNEIIKINKQLINLENKLLPNYKEKLEKELKIKQEELSEHIKNKPNEIKNPALDEHTKEHNKKISTQINVKNTERESLSSTISEKKNKKVSLNQEIQELLNIQEDFKRFEIETKSFLSSNKEKLEKYGLEIDKIFKYEINLTSIEKKIEIQKKEYKNITELLLSKNEIEGGYSKEKQKNIEKNSLVVRLDELEIEIKKLKGQLSEPFKKYQDYLEKRKKWENGKIELEGKIDIPQTINWYKNELIYLEKELPEIIETKRQTRIKKTKGYYSAAKLTIDCE